MKLRYIPILLAVLLFATPAFGADKCRTAAGFVAQTTASAHKIQLPTPTYRVFVGAQAKALDAYAAAQTETSPLPVDRVVLARAEGAEQAFWAFFYRGCAVRVTSSLDSQVEHILAVALGKPS